MGAGQAHNPLIFCPLIKWGHWDTHIQGEHPMKMGGGDQGDHSTNPEVPEIASNPPKASGERHGPSLPQPVISNVWPPELGDGAFLWFVCGAWLRQPRETNVGLQADRCLLRPLGSVTHLGPSFYRSHQE